MTFQFFDCQDKDVVCGTYPSVVPVDGKGPYKMSFEVMGDAYFLENNDQIISFETNTGQTGLFSTPQVKLRISENWTGVSPIIVYGKYEDMASDQFTSPCIESAKDDLIIIEWQISKPIAPCPSLINYIYPPVGLNVLPYKIELTTFNSPIAFLYIQENLADFVPHFTAEDLDVNWYTNLCDLCSESEVLHSVHNENNFSGGGFITDVYGVFKDTYIIAVNNTLKFDEVAMQLNPDLGWSVNQSYSCVNNILKTHNLRFRYAAQNISVEIKP